MIIILLYKMKRWPIRTGGASFFTATNPAPKDIQHKPEGQFINLARINHNLTGDIQF
ncbi:hypothetical protein Q668_00270 [Alcanivorax sp. PN-3]|nr:hypothetical protein Q668_00270 [Alcanivorax sp. PN-3]